MIRLISRNKKYPFEIQDVVKYEVEVATDEKSVAKTYETKNTLIVVLHVPKISYKNEEIQKLLAWANSKKYDENYYRDLAVHMNMVGANERSIVFTHAEVTAEIESKTKADFVKITLFVNQKRDKFVGVAFGIELDETYERAWDRVNNPPRLNIFVPAVVNKLTNNEYAVPYGTDTSQKDPFYKELLIKGFQKMNFHKGLMLSTNFPETLNKYTFGKRFNSNRVKKSDGVVRIWYSIANGGALYRKRDAYYCISFKNNTTQEVKIKIIDYNCQVGGIWTTAMDVLNFFTSTNKGKKEHPINVTGANTGSTEFTISSKTSENIFITNITTAHEAICGFIDFKIVSGDEIWVVDYAVKDKSEAETIPGSFYRASNVGVIGDIENLKSLDTLKDGDFIREDVDIMDYKCYSGHLNSYRIFCNASIKTSEFKERSTYRNVGFETGNNRADNANKPSDLITTVLADEYPATLTIKEAKFDGKFDGEFNGTQKFNIEDPLNYHNIGNWSIEYLIQLDIINDNNSTKSYDLYLVPASYAGFLFAELKSDVFDGTQKNLSVINTLNKPTIIGGSAKFIPHMEGNKYYDGVDKFGYLSNKVDRKNNIIKQAMFQDEVFSKYIAVKKGISVKSQKKITINYLYVLATQTNSHVFHVLVQND